jgi:hypothetical protein
MLVKIIATTDVWNSRAGISPGRDARKTATKDKD